MKGKLLPGSHTSASPLSCTSDCSPKSSCGSNNYQDCLKMFDDQESAEKLHWTSTMDFNFITSYVDWKKTQQWDSRKTNDQNYEKLAAHLREHFSMPVIGGQCASRMYRFKRKWNLFSSLRGLSSKAETGIGWDEESNCFTADKEHWKALAAGNNDYKDFKKPGSCYLYELYTEIALGNTATGSFAQSAARPLQNEPVHTDIGPSMTRKNKGKAPVAFSEPPAHSTCPWEGEDVYYVPPVPGAPAAKRPASSLGTSGDRECARGAKKSRTSSDRTERLDDALSKIDRLSTVSIETKLCRMEDKAKYGVAAVQDIVNSMNLTEPVKTKAKRYFAKGGNEGQRVLFVREEEPGRYAYIDDLMEELACRKPSS